MAKIESISVLLCLAVLACGDDSSDPEPARTPDSGVSTPRDGGGAGNGGGSRPDATTPPVVDGASKPPDAGTGAPDAGSTGKPDAATTGASTIEDGDSLVSVCLGPGCPAGKCGVNTTSCDGLYDDALSGSYDFCPSSASGNYCLVTCPVSKFDGDCDLAKAETYRIVDCDGAAPSITPCGSGQGCATSGDGVACN